MSPTIKGGLMQAAALGAVLITILMLPFQALTPFAVYSPLLIVPVILFFALQAPPQALVGMFLSFACGVGWAALFMLGASASPACPCRRSWGSGVTLVIFLVLFVHPILLGGTPLGVVPAVLLGTVASLLVMTTTPLLAPGVPMLNLLWLLVIFAYGCAMTFVLVFVQGKIMSAVFGAQTPLTRGGAR